MLSLQQLEGELQMKKLYIYPTVGGFEGSWDEAVTQKVEIYATIEGEDQRAIEKIAYEFFRLHIRNNIPLYAR